MEDEALRQAGESCAHPRDGQRSLHPRFPLHVQWFQNRVVSKILKHRHQCYLNITH